MKMVNQNTFLVRIKLHDNNLKKIMKIRSINKSIDQLILKIKMIVCNNQE